MSLNNIKRNETQLKNLGEIVIKKYGLNKAEENLKSLTKLNSNAKELFGKTKKQNKTSTPYTFFKSSPQVILNHSNSNTSRSTSTNNLTNPNEINNPNEELNTNAQLLQEMYNNINRIRNKNLYLNTKLKLRNENNQQDYNQEDLKALQNYVKTQRYILKKINANIKEANEIKKKYTFQILMEKDNKKKLSKLLTKENKIGIELHVNNAVKKIKTIVNKNARSKFRNMVDRTVKSTGTTTENRMIELKKQHYDSIKNIKPMTRFNPSP